MTVRTAIGVTAGTPTIGSRTLDRRTGKSSAATALMATTLLCCDRRVYDTSPGLLGPTACRTRSAPDVREACGPFRSVTGCGRRQGEFFAGNEHRTHVEQRLLDTQRAAPRRVTPRISDLHLRRFGTPDRPAELAVLRAVRRLKIIEGAFHRFDAVPPNRNVSKAFWQAQADALNKALKLDHRPDGKR